MKSKPDHMQSVDIFKEQQAKAQLPGTETVVSVIMKPSYASEYSQKKNDKVQLFTKRANTNENQNVDIMHIFNICTKAIKVKPS